jgi:8-amino-7-oxononanoate synthase
MSPTREQLEQRWREQLADLAARGRLRSLCAPSGHDFSSNDVLGLGDSPIAATGSRLLRGHRQAWDALEHTLAEWHGAEAALVFGSGYAANEGVLSTLIEPGDFVLSDALNHASIIDGLRLARAERFIYRHGDLAHVREGLELARGRACFIVTESLFGMDGDIAPLAELVALARAHGALVVVDEAHATGVFGAQGSGLVDAHRLRSEILASVHTGGKALGVPGAYVAGSTLLRDVLVNRCRSLIYTTALPPIAAEWWQASVKRVREDPAARERVQMLARDFRGALDAHAVPHFGESYIVGIPLGSDERAVRVAAQLQREGYDIRAIRPPTVPEGTSRLRVSVHADHTPELLSALATSLAIAIR